MTRVPRTRCCDSETIHGVDGVEIAILQAPAGQKAFSQTVRPRDVETRG